MKPKLPVVSSGRNKHLASPMYNKGYIDQAHKKKKRGVWTGFGVGTAVLIAVGLASVN